MSYIQQFHFHAVAELLRSSTANAVMFGSMRRLLSLVPSPLYFSLLKVKDVICPAPLSSPGRTLVAEFHISAESPG